MTTPSEQPNAPAAAPTPARRTQRRISVQIPIKVYRPGSKMPITAMNHDISWGGAQFVATVPVAWMTGRLRLDFPWAGGQQISIDAEVVRAQQLSEGVSQVAVRFVSLSPRCQVRLEKLLTMLDPGGQGSADGVTEPLFQGIELEIHDLPEMREALQQIAEGRLKLVVTEPYQPGKVSAWPSAAFPVSPPSSCARGCSRSLQARPVPRDSKAAICSSSASSIPLTPSRSSPIC